MAQGGELCRVTMREERTVTRSPAAGPLALVGQYSGTLLSIPSMFRAIEQVPSGFVYSDDPVGRYQVAANLIGFRELTGLQAKGALEKYMEPGVLQDDGAGNTVFVPKSFSTDFCAGLIQSDQLKEKLPRIARLLTVPLPFRIGDRLSYPKKEYDHRFATYLLPDAPELFRMGIEDAKVKIDSILSGFCFTNAQSRTHAVARLLTPFARAPLGWTTRVPLWFFAANRPRAGKDYLSGCTLIIYEGAAFEDLPIGKDSEETAKRIMSTARNGRPLRSTSHALGPTYERYLGVKLAKELGGSDWGAMFLTEQQLAYA
jgi:hypothetical protein